MNSKIETLFQTVKNFDSKKEILNFRKKTQNEVSHKIEQLVEKLLINTKYTQITAEERKEVLHMLFSKIDKNNFTPSFDYIKTLVHQHGTNNLKKILNIRENIAKNLVEDARARLKSRTPKSSSKKTLQN